MKKFNLFLITFLVLTAFLAGYLIVSGGLGGSMGLGTGTILDKFDEEEGSPDQPKKNEEIAPFLITNRQVTSPVTSSDKKGVVYYEKGSGKVFEYRFDDSKETSVSDKILPNFMSTLWSPNRNEVISLFYSGTGKEFKYFNFKTLKSVGLEPQVKSLAFSPDGNLIAYYYKEAVSSTSTTGKIILSQPDGSYQKNILNTRIEDIELSWPIKDQLSLKTPTNELFLLTEGGQLTKLTEPKLSLEAKWSLNGDKVLLSSLNYLSTSESAVPESILSIKNIETREEKFLDIAGRASKCTWSIDGITIYCALAKTPSVDNIYAIDILTGKKKLIAEPEMAIKELLVSSLEEYLVFISASDEKLYGLRLP